MEKVLAAKIVIRSVVTKQEEKLDDILHKMGAHNMFFDMAFYGLFTIGVAVLKKRTFAVTARHSLKSQIDFYQENRTPTTSAMMKLSNPYTAGNPVYGRNKFIGRADVLCDVLWTLSNPDTNAIMLFGQRRIGKTSILLHIQQELIEKHEYTPIYFDLQHKASFPLVDVLYHIAQKISFVLKTPLPRREQFDVSGKFFREVFIPAAVKIVKSQGLILLFDECGVLDLSQPRPAGISFFPYLQHWLKVGEGLQAVFALGRRPGKLSANSLLTFKAMRSRKILLMTREECAAIIRQSEKNASLRWSDKAVTRVWYWTQGHPYFTQLLCSEIWEAAFAERDFVEHDARGERDSPGDLTIRSPANVDAAIGGALVHGAHAFQWIWHDLSLAEQLVMAAMAEIQGDHISQKEFMEVLNHSGVRSILPEIKIRLNMLIWWELLRPANEGFRFAVPLLRRWVITEKPLRRVKATLEVNLERLAESLHRSAKDSCERGNLNKAALLLHNVLHLHPNSFRTPRC